MTVLPYPLLWISLTLMWLLLNGFTLGHALLGAIVALFSCWSMASLRPNKPHLRRWYLLPKLLAIFLVDVIRSNISLVRIILGNGEPQSGFVTVKLELRDPSALSLLAVILTATPGSAWVEYEAREGKLLVHVLDLMDEESWQDLIKNRYEKLLMEIFE